MKMNHSRRLGLALLLALAVTALFSVGTATATTLEVGGVAKNSSVEVIMSLKSGTSTLFKDESGTTTDTCTTSEGAGASGSPFTATAIWIWWNSWTFKNCTHTTTVLKRGHIHFIWISGTTNASVSLSETEWTLQSTFFGASAVCKTGSGTKVGTLTGVSSGNATLDINATINCGILGNSSWTGTYTVTSPAGFGAVS
jgi:hypothetical protein